jgi:indole-3-glycerol phosphate synthase
MLERILLKKREEIQERKARMPLEGIKRAVQHAPPPRGFRRAIESSAPIALIAEVKFASPSGGILRPRSKVRGEAKSIALAYLQGGATALSVLTDEAFFQGSVEDFREVREAVEAPMLRKDFLMDEYQIFESRALGADAVLLIVRALEEEKELSRLFSLTRELGMDALVEVHSEEELQKALRVGADLIGINNRDLQTLKVDLSLTERLAPLVGEGVVLVSESGITSYADVLRVKRAGVKGVLVGEHLMRQKDLVSAVRSLMEPEGNKEP